MHRVHLGRSFVPWSVYHPNTPMDTRAIATPSQFTRSSLHRFTVFVVSKGFRVVQMLECTN
uniref:Uncharacterized protein n=1 Tax=Anguilla anguilla TaxID=7936 RepID=A0A0E9W8T5_ANGAN